MYTCTSLDDISKYLKLVCHMFMLFSCTLKTIHVGLLEKLMASLITLAEMAVTWDFKERVKMEGQL